MNERRRFNASSACRGAIPVPTVATSEVQRIECLSRGYSSAYSRNVGGSTHRVPVEGLFQCLQSQRRRFNAPSLKCQIRRDFKDTGHVAQHSTQTFSFANTKLSKNGPCRIK